MQYLTDWRMTIARDLLRTDHTTLNQIAARTGYARHTPSPPPSAAITATRPDDGVSVRQRLNRSSPGW